MLTPLGLDVDGFGRYNTRMTNNNNEQGNDMTYNFANTIGGKLCAELRTEVMEAIVVPNSMLPAKFHDNVRGGRTLARLEQLTEKRDGITDHVKLKALRERNVARLSAQVDEGSHDITKPFDYSANECDELQLHRNKSILIDGMISGGLLSDDDLTED